ncbi:hypothetical protein Tco_0396083 [Tanacetum coccineum]
MADSQPLKEGVRRTLPEYRVTRPLKGSVASFPPKNDHPTSTFVSQTGNTLRTINIKPIKRLELKKKPYPSSRSMQMFTSVAQQMVQGQKRSFGKQNLSVNRKGKHKSINGKEPKKAKRVRHRTIIEMIRGNTNKKRPRKQSEQWLSNEISLPSMSGCQLVNSPIILEALIEGF